MAEVGNLTAKLTLNTAGFSKGAEEAQSLAKKLAGGIGQTLGSVSTAVAGAVAASAAAVGKLVHDAVSSFADYEQLVGGVETLFKESAGIVQDYAMEAYKTAGISANEYMSTVTSFSASLLQSLGGDTEEAAHMANQAIIDMADNANKMGSSMESIQNAYQGFAKQNYTMLDNLKLGYGGTKEEMERLLLDAEKLDSTFRITHEQVKKKNGEMKEELVYNYADIVKAIHIVQTEMGITGTTSKEAATTITGSWNMVKASWQDLLTSIAGGGKGLHEGVVAFVDSVKTFAENLIPVIQEALYGIGDLITELAPVIMEAVPSLIETVLPGLIDAAISLTVSLINALPQILSVLSQAIPDIVTQLLTVISDMLMMLFTTGLPMLMELVINVVTSIANFLIENLPILIPALADMVSFICMTVIEHLPEFLELGVKIVLAIIEGILLAIPRFIGAIAQLLGIVDGAKDTTSKGFKSIEDNAKATSQNISNMSFNVGKGVSDASKKTVETGNEIEKSTKAVTQNVKDDSGKIIGYYAYLEDGTRQFVQYTDRMIDFINQTTQEKSQGVSESAETAATRVENAVDRINSALSSISSASIDVGARASGGPVLAGHPYVTGEKGRELFVPSTDGYIFNNDDTEDIFGSFGGGGITVVIEGDVYDDERSMREKLTDAVLDILRGELAYG